ncbi:Polyphenol oxidase 1 [Dinochytrium kinnereticum]|nr:Polyphenol oxidase 1 [Dinochytrium kinnereticum]
MAENHQVLQRRLNAALSIPPGDAESNAKINPQGFTVFDPKQLELANRVATDLYRIANENPTAPIAAVLDEVERKLADDVNDNEAVRHALMIFITHSPIAQRNGLKVSALTSRASQLAVPISSQLPAPDPEDSEVALNYWREDVNLNEHHEHWHIVYPGGGIPDPRNPGVFRAKDRQGELFAFMHQQMLARYNAERLVNGFEDMKPIMDFRQPLEGDVPDGNLRYSGQAFSARKNGIPMQDLGTQGQRDYLPLSSLEQSRDRIIEAIKAGKFRDGTPITANLLGATLENDVEGVDQAYYGNLHNMGHVIISYLANPKRWQDRNVVPGLMYTTRTAVRDPVFWRWHGHIDELFAMWQNTQPPNTFQDSPLVRLRKTLGTGSAQGNTSFASPDIIMVYRDILEAEGVNVADDLALDAWGEKTFGGAQWDAPANSKYSTDVLETEMRMRSFTNVGDDHATENIAYVFPREVVYFFRVENPTAEKVDVTLRVNMVPAARAENRRAYFEMDKFIASIPANSKKVVSRRMDDASVIRKPAQKTVEQMDDRRDEDDGLDRAGDQYCDCGWPFNMLVPRGTPEGTHFRLAVLATDAKIDRVPTKSGCGSLTFCGAKEKYPDFREMGYPYNRNFPDGISKTIGRTDCWAAKDIVIRFAVNGIEEGKMVPVPATEATPAPPSVINNGPSPAISVPTPPTTAGQDPTTTVTKSADGNPVTVRTLTRTNGDIEIIRTETLPNGSKKVTRTIRQKVAAGSKPPFDPTKKGVVRQEIETDERGRKVEVTETVGDDGVRRIFRKVLA